MLLNLTRTEVEELNCGSFAFVANLTIIDN